MGRSADSALNFLNASGSLRLQRSKRRGSERCWCPGCAEPVLSPTGSGGGVSHRRRALGTFVRNRSAEPGAPRGTAAKPRDANAWARARTYSRPTRGATLWRARTRTASAAVGVLSPYALGGARA